MNGKITILNRFILRCIEKFMPFFKLLRKNTSIFWNEECKYTFQNIKAYLDQQLILLSLTLSELMNLYLTISTLMMNVLFLIERDKVQHLIYYVSQVLIDTQGKYPVLDKLAFPSKLLPRNLGTTLDHKLLLF